MPIDTAALLGCAPEVGCQNAFGFWIVMGPSQDSASTRLWVGIFWPTRTRFFWKSQDSASIGLDFLRLRLARTQLFPAQPITSTDRELRNCGVCERERGDHFKRNLANPHSGTKYVQK